MKKILPVLFSIGCLVSVNVFADSKNVENSIFSTDIGVSNLSSSEMKETEGAGFIIDSQLSQAFSNATGVGGLVGVGVGVSFANNFSNNIVLPSINIDLR